MPFSIGDVFYLKRTDREPALQVQLLDRDGSPADLTGGTVAFRMRPEGGGDLKVEAAATVIDADTADVSYAWAAADVDTAGSFDAEFVVTKAGKTARYPNDGYIEIRIVPELADVEPVDIPIVTVSELESHMREEFDSLALIVADDILTMCQGTLEAWCGRPITVREFSADMRISKLTETRLYLPYTPVVSVASVSIDGGPALTLDTDYVVERFGLDDFYGLGKIATITWTAGVDGRARENSALRFAVLRAAKREMTHWREDDAGLEDVRSEGYAAKFLAPDSVFTQKELGACLRYKRRKMR